MTWEAREIVDLGDRVLVRVGLTARGKHSELPISEEVGHLYTVAEAGRRKLVIFRSWAEALAAV